MNNSETTGESTCLQHPACLSYGDRCRPSVWLDPDWQGFLAPGSKSRAVANNICCALLSMPSWTHEAWLGTSMWQLISKDLTQRIRQLLQIKVEMERQREKSLCCVTTACFPQCRAFSLICCPPSPVCQQLLQAKLYTDPHQASAMCRFAIMQSICWPRDKQ